MAFDIGELEHIEGAVGAQKEARIGLHGSDKKLKNFSSPHQREADGSRGQVRRLRQRHEPDAHILQSWIKVSTRSTMKPNSFRPHAETQLCFEASRGPRVFARSCSIAHSIPDDYSLPARS
jgi:hypothetical protein